MDNSLATYGLISKIINIENSPKANVTIAVFNNDVLSMILAVDLDDDGLDRIANKFTMQLAYVDSLSSLSTKLKQAILVSLFRVVRDLYEIRFVHLYLKPSLPNET